MSLGNGKLSLHDARQTTPPVNAVEAMRRQMAIAAFGAVKENDVLAIVEKLKGMAMEGDHKAMKMYLEMVGVMGKQQPAPAAQNQEAATKLSEVLRDLVDEIRVARARTGEPQMMHELGRLADSTDTD